MRSTRQSFGKREPLRIHGTIALNARRRTFCSIITKRENVVYLSLSENVTIPFRFRIEFDFDQSWIDCEFKSQIDGTIVAMIVAASAEKRPAYSLQTNVSATLNDIEAWQGAKKISG
jgi:hypothetical protein